MLKTTVAVASLAGMTTAQSVEFSAPVRLKADGAHIRTENPGYAAPALHDVNGDGIKDLAVGQFHEGKIRIYPGKKDGGFAKGAWLKAGDAIAKVPDVW